MHELLMNGCFHLKRELKLFDKRAQHTKPSPVGSRTGLQVTSSLYSVHLYLFIDNMYIYCIINI